MISKKHICLIFQCAKRGIQKNSELQYPDSFACWQIIMALRVLTSFLFFNTPLYRKCGVSAFVYFLYTLGIFKSKKFPAFLQAEGVWQVSFSLYTPPRKMPKNILRRGKKSIYPVGKNIKKVRCISFLHQQLNKKGCRP